LVLKELKVLVLQDHKVLKVLKVMLVKRDHKEHKVLKDLKGHLQIED